MKKYAGWLSPEIAWGVLRIFFGLFFIRAGTEKLGNFSGQTLTYILTSWINGGNGVPPNPYPWYVDFLKGTVIPHAALFAGLVTAGEILVGIGLLLGLFTPIVALIGAFLNLNYYLAGAQTGASDQGLNAMFIVVQILFSLACVGQYYGVDWFRLRQRHPAVDNQGASKSAVL